jgi:hypothetical protein
MATDKLAKQAVQFEHPASMSDHCRDCRFYLAPVEQCRFVAGDIQPQDWCVLFQEASRGRKEAAKQ